MLSKLWQKGFIKSAQGQHKLGVRYYKSFKWSELLSPLWHDKLVRLLIANISILV